LDIHKACFNLAKRNEFVGSPAASSDGTRGMLVFTNPEAVSACLLLYPEFRFLVGFVQNQQ
jgi:hypothetical protein